MEFFGIAKIWLSSPAKMELFSHDWDRIKDGQKAIGYISYGSRDSKAEHRNLNILYKCIEVVCFNKKKQKLAFFV